MDHELKWNAASQKWMCIRCLRTSDQQLAVDAEKEMSQFECIPPMPVSPVRNS